MYGLRDDTFVFCAFNNSNKINLEVFEAWMNILRRVPNSQLWLSGLGSARVLEENLRAEARQRDINPNRLVFAERIADKSVHFARHRMADLFLDTFAYTAATTALDALWAGLPVLTRPGASFYSRICASMVANAGLTDMICANTEEYENRAVHLATHPEELRNIRARLAENLPLAPLFDVPRFVRHLEVAYEKMWELHRAGTARASFDVAAIPRGGDASRDASQ
jgi:predicted O-linked N-acetylglucosamine transferase (SPINDLY family)